MSVEENVKVVEAQENWKMKILLIGGVVGLLTGLGAAYMLIQRAEQQDTRPRLGAGEGVKLGVWVFGLLRQVASLGEGK